LHEPPALKETLINLLIKLKGQGYKNSFLHGLSHILRNINKNAPINNPEAIKTFIASKTDDNYKVKLGIATLSIANTSAQISLSQNTNGYRRYLSCP